MRQHCQGGWHVPPCHPLQRRKKWFCTWLLENSTWSCQALALQDIKKPFFLPCYVCIVHCSLALRSCARILIYYLKLRIFQMPETAALSGFVVGSLGLSGFVNVILVQMRLPRTLIFSPMKLIHEKMQSPPINIPEKGAYYYHVH